MANFALILLFLFSFTTAITNPIRASEQPYSQDDESFCIQNYIPAEDAQEELDILIKNLTSSDINLQIESAANLSALINMDSYSTNRLFITAVLEDYLPDIMDSSGETGCRYSILCNLSNFIFKQIPNNFIFETTLYEISNIIHTLSQIEDAPKILSEISPLLFDTVFRKELNEKTRSKIFYCLYDIIPILNDEDRAAVAFNMIDNLSSLESHCEYMPYIEFIADIFPYLLDSDIEKAITNILQKIEVDTLDIATKTDLLCKVMPYMNQTDKIKLLQEAADSITIDNKYSFGFIVNTLLAIIPSLENNEIKTDWLKKLQGLKESFIEDKNYLTVLNMLIKDKNLNLENKLIFRNALLDIAVKEQNDLERKAIAANILYTIAELSQDLELKDIICNNMGFNEKEGLIYKKYGISVFNAERKLEDRELGIINSLLDELPFYLTGGLTGIILNPNGPSGVLGTASCTGLINIYGERLGEDIFIRGFLDTFYHEIAHTISDRVLTQREWLNFKVLSGQSYTRFDFAEIYGMHTASEDFSTTFAMYMLDTHQITNQARNINGHYSDILLEKLEFIASLFITPDNYIYGYGINENNNFFRKEYQISEDGLPDFWDLDLIQE